MKLQRELAIEGARVKVWSSLEFPNIRWLTSRMSMTDLIAEMPTLENANALARPTPHRCKTESVLCELAYLRRDGLTGVDVMHS